MRDLDLQVLRVTQSNEDVIVFFHPNVADAELSPDTAASFTCEFSDAQVPRQTCLIPCATACQLPVHCNTLLKIPCTAYEPS